jgi:hypothetical protein
MTSTESGIEMKEYKQVPTSEPGAETAPTAGEDAPPPSYNSLNIIRQLQRVQSVEDPKEKLSQVAAIVGGSVLTTVFLIIYSALPVVQIIVGIFNKENCQIQTMIPVWLIVMGSGSLII